MSEKEKETPNQNSKEKVFPEERGQLPKEEKESPFTQETPEKRIDGENQYEKEETKSISKEN